MEKTELISLAKVYFKHNENLNEIHATEDGHFFYQEGLAIVYCKKNGKRRFTITRDEAIPKKGRTAKTKEEAKSKEKAKTKEEAKSKEEAKPKEEAKSKEEAKPKEERLKELEAKGDARTNDEDDEYEDLIAELKKAKK